MAKSPSECTRLRFGGDINQRFGVVYWLPFVVVVLTVGLLAAMKVEKHRVWLTERPGYRVLFAVFPHPFVARVAVGFTLNGAVAAVT